MEEQLVECGACKGLKVLLSDTRSKSAVACQACKSTGKSPPAKDIDGNPIVPGALVRIIPQFIEGTLDKKTLSYKGRVYYISVSSKGKTTIAVQALPSLVGDANTHNHGFHFARPEHVRLIKGTAHTKRLDLYERKQHGET